MTALLSKPLRKAVTTVAWLVAPSTEAGACTAGQGSTCNCVSYRYCSGDGHCVWLYRKYIEDCYGNCYWAGGYC